MSAVDTEQGAIALDSPYVGLKPYTQENAVMFFGRDREQTVLISNLRSARLTLLYAQSGAGKSSLLRAGVAVRLTELARRDFDQRGSARNIPVVFSSWRDDPTAELIGGIQKAIIPFLQQAAPPEQAPDRLDQAIEAANRVTGAALLVILDQFEDYFPHQSREMPNQPFADELAACINRADLRAKFLISIREDAYSFLGDLFEGRISNVYGNYFHLEHLTRQAAREAIEKPIASFNKLHMDRAPVHIEPDLIDVVLYQLSQFAADQGGIGRDSEGNGAGPHRDEVAAPYLQLVMKRLWDTELGKPYRTLRRETLKELGNAKEIVKTHIDRVLGNLPDEQREAAVDILQRLVTPSGTRIALAASDLADPDYTGRPVDEVDAALQRLVGSDDRIMSTVLAPPGRPGGTRYEIAHDLLVPAILDWGRRLRAARLESEKEAAERQAQIEKRRARMFGALAIGSAVLLVLVIVLAIVVGKADQNAVSQAHLAQSEEQDAVGQSHLAQSEEMAAEATNLLPANGPLAMLLSLQAYERAHSLRAESALIQASQQPLDDLLVSGSPVNSVTFSPDGYTLAVSDEHGDVGLWDVTTGQRTVLAEGSPVYGVAFSPDGHTLAAGDARGDIRLWDVATGRRTATLAEGTLVNSVAFSPNGHTLAAGDNRGDVGLWNVATRQRTATLAEGSSVQSVKFSPNGHTLVIGDVGGNVGLWNVATQQRTATLAEGNPVNSVAFSPNGHTLAIGDAGGNVGLWNVATQQRTATLAEGSPAFSVAFSPNGQTLAAGDGGDHVGLWNLVTRQRTVTLAEGNLVQSVAFSPNGQAVAAGDAGGDVGLWDVATGRATNLAEGNIVNSVAFTPNGRILAAGDASGEIGLWDVTTGQRTATLAVGSTVESIAFSPNGQTLAVGDARGHIGLWDVATRQRIAILPEGTFVYSVAFSPNGQTLAAGDAGDHVGVWDVATRQRIAMLPEGSPVQSVAFSANNQTLAAGDFGGHIGLWDVATRRRTATLAVGSTVESVALSPNGQTLAAGDFGGDIGLWGVASGRRTATLAEGNPVYSVAFSPNGPILVTGDSLGDVDLWNTASRQRFANLVEGSTVASLAFPPHGQVLAIAGLNGNIVLVWQDLTNLTQRFFVHLICGKVRGNMTQAQWAEYAPGQPYQKTCP
jgi:WD40 repeat protein